ncbi:MAG: hypothetical protein IKJ45_00670 [Kiritimatiellae bacterium]|nr:hypothetical protein [Kiritimatiellia bacterium]
MSVGCPQTAGRASRSGAGLAIGRRGEVGGGAKLAVERRSERADTAYSPRFREEKPSATALLI